MTLMYNTIYDCNKMHVFYVNNIDIEEIFHCKIFTHLFNIYFHFFFINGIEFTWIQFTFNQKKSKFNIYLNMDFTFCKHYIYCNIR